MTQAETLQISLSGEAATQVRDALESGEYVPANDVVIDALRNWNREREDLDVDHLKAAWEETMRDDSPGLEPEPVFAAVRARLDARLKK